MGVVVKKQRGGGEIGQEAGRKCFGKTRIRTVEAMWENKMWQGQGGK